MRQEGEELMSKEAMKLALEALLHCKDAIVERGLNGSPEFAEKWGLTLPLERADQAITALREALAEQPAQQEPVAVHQFRKRGCSDWYDGHPDHTDGGGPYEARTLYTSPPAQRKPLTDEQIEDIWADCPADWDDKINVLTLARAIEAAHGIKENT